MRIGGTAIVVGAAFNYGPDIFNELGVSSSQLGLLDNLTLATSVTAGFFMGINQRYLAGPLMYATSIMPEVSNLFNRAGEVAINVASKVDLADVEQTISDININKAMTEMADISDGKLFAMKTGAVCLSYAFVTVLKTHEKEYFFLICVFYSFFCFICWKLLT